MEVDMKKYIFFVFLVFSNFGFPQWIRRADIQGNINDIAYLDGVFYIATEGAGVWKGDGTNWTPLIDGLPSLNVKAVCIKPDNRNYVKAVVDTGEVYWWDTGTTQSQWLLDGTGLANQGYIPTDLSMVRDTSGTFYTYLTTRNAMILRQNGLGGSWLPCRDELTDISFKSIATYPSTNYGHIALAGTFDNGRIYYHTGSNCQWTQATISGGPNTGAAASIALHNENFAIASFEAQGYGLFYTTNFSYWYPLCQSISSEKFYSVDYVPSGTNLCVATGTAKGIYSLTTDLSGSCIKTYTPFINSRGSVSSIAIRSNTFALAGGPQKGPSSFNPCNETSPFTNQREGLRDYNALSITPSTNYQINDNTIFVASGVAGLYKNIDEIDSNSSTKRGYFYRMISNYEEDGVLPVLKIKIPPAGYLETACLGQKKIYALTNGKGLWYSPYGGRSWEHLYGSQGELSNQIITDMVFRSDSEFIISLYGKDVYITTDSGANFSPLGNIPNKNVLSLAVSPSGLPVFAGCTYDPATGAQAGLYKYSTEGWQLISTTSGAIVSQIALHPNYPSVPWIFIGTQNEGVWVSINNGSSFTQLGSGQIPPNARIYDLKLSPQFSSDFSIMVAADNVSSNLKKGIFFTRGSWSWYWYNIVQGLPEDKVLSVAFSPTFLSEGQIFAGTALNGLYDSNLNIIGSTPSVNFKKASGFYNVPPNITGISVAPDDPKIVFASTMYDGIFKSRDGGDTFLPWNWGLQYLSGTQYCPVENTLSVQVTDMVLSGSYLINEGFSSGIPSTWTIINGGTIWTWRTDNPCSRALGSPLEPPFAIIDSDCEGPSGVQDDWLITPTLDTSSLQKVILQFDHNFTHIPGYDSIGKVKVCSSATGGNCSSSTGDWVTVLSFKGGNFGPEKVNLDLTSYKGTNFRVAFHYIGSWDYYWAVDNVKIFNGSIRRVIIGTKDHGIYYGNYDDSAPGYDGVNQSNKTDGIINEIRYLNLSEDIRATDKINGDFASNDFGANWYQVQGATYGLTDMSYGSGIIRELGHFIWGASSGKSLSLRSGSCNNQGRAWYRPSSGTWTQCSTTGIDTCEDFRSILQVGSSSILLGSIDIGGTGSWVGLYRSDNSCSSFKPSAEGLPPNPKVYAFYQNSGSDKFILAAVEDSDPAPPDNGGIYYSDSNSNGRAWVKTNLPSSAPSSYEISSSSGTTIFAGLSGDGIFSSVPSSIQITSPPTAYFEVQSDVCVNTPVQFYDYSSGKCTSWYWLFGDGNYSNLQNPTHTYLSSGTFYPTLTSTNSNGSDSYPNSPYDVSIVVRDELDVGNTLRISKTGNPNEIQLVWNDITNETGYRVYASNVPSSYQTSFPSLPANTTSYIQRQIIHILEFSHCLQHTFVVME